MNNKYPATNSARITADMIDVATEVLSTLLDFSQPADAVLSNYFRNHRELGSRERAFVADTAYAVLRRKRFLERLCGDKWSPRQLVLAALIRVQGMSQRQLGETLSADEDKWLIEFKARPEPVLSPAEQCDLPDWLYERLATAYSAEQILDMARALNQPAPLDLRVNTLKATRDEVLALLEKYHITAEPCC
jgi:16S rRNA (cytosine967-C5)-methyltransferase